MKKVTHRQLMTWWKFHESWHCAHEFIKVDDDLHCHKCKHIKYKIELDAEADYIKKLNRVKLSEGHIDLFHF